MPWEDEYYNDLPGLDKNKRNPNSVDAVETSPFTTKTSHPTEENGEANGILGDLETMLNPTTSLEYLQTQANEAKEKKDRSLGIILNDIDLQNKELERQRSGIRVLTDEELDKRRQSGSLVSSITSALANIANGIAVSKGAMNATVPDGYQLSYQHWNDVEARNAKRRAEFDKITNAIWSNQLTKAKLQYGEDSAEYQSILKRIEDEQKMRNAIHVKTIEQQEKITEALLKAESAEKIASDRNATNKEIAYINSNTKKEIAKLNGTIDLENYRTYNGTNGTIEIPDDMDIEDGYLVLAREALDYLDTIQETSANKNELANKKKALREALTGSSKDKSDKLKKLSTAIANSGVPQSRLESALNLQTQLDNGGTGTSDDPDDPAGAF